MRFLQAIILLSVFQSWAVLSFVQPPVIVYNASQSNWIISFEVSETTDVEVAVVDLRDSVIVRHLAAGVLGANPPPPLAAHALSQNLVWDGKDDFGDTLSIPLEKVSVRVRAGMRPDFERFVGGDPYAFRDENVGGCYWSMNGISEGDSGQIYVSGSSEPLQFAAIRAYDASGNYVRTVFPFRGDLQASQISGFGVNNWLNGKYSPQFVELRGPTFSNTILSSFNGYSMLPINGPGKIAVGGGKGLQCFIFNADGTIPAGAAQVSLVTTPALPYGLYLMGPVYLNPSRNTDYCYLSGFEQCEIANWHFGGVHDTGFWRDGCVWKINMKSGVASQFITIDSVPLNGVVLDTTLGGPGDFYTSIHSIKEAPNGDVLICDRVHRQIGVYDSNGLFLRAIRDVPNPDQIALDKTTGAVYVICRSGWHYDAKPLILKKFSGYGDSDSLLFSKTLWLNYAEGPVSLIVKNEAGGRAKLWIGSMEKGVRIYGDAGDSVTLDKDFSAVKVPTLGFDRIGIDRGSETVFITNGANAFYKITDWSNPAIVRCSTSAKQPLLAGDLCVSYDGQLYVREQGADAGSAWNGPISRYSMDYYHEPIPFANTGTNRMCQEIYGRFGAGYADKGLAVSPVDKHVAYMSQHTFAMYWIDTLEAGGTMDSVIKVGQNICFPRTIVNVTGASANSCGQGGLKFDLKGNLYFGATVSTPGHRTPAGFESDFAYTRGGGGSVVSYAPGDTGSITSDAGNPFSNARYIYKSDLGPMSYAQGGCQCRSSRFDVDAYGRLFIPSGVTQKVAVVDNNDNPIIEFGRYGNWDEQGVGADIPFACPLAAAASDNYIYVNDLINTRMARIKMAYALDNMPGLPIAASEGKDGHKGLMAMTASPNPFNPESRIIYSLPVSGHVNLSVYDLSGRLVKTLVSGEARAGQHTVRWDATNMRGEKVSAGMYLYRLAAQGKTLKFRSVLAK